MSSAVVPIWVWWLDRLITTITASDEPGSVFEKQIRFGLSTEWKCSVRSCCSAGCARRISLSRRRYGARLRPDASAAAQSRGRSWYFSLSRYSSLPGRTATCSKSSKPE